MPDPLLLLRAADYAARKHRDQRRKSGDVPYINHPLGVARSLVDEGGIDDPVVLAAAILHDTVEDTDTTPAELEQEFGSEIAGIVAEVTDDTSLRKVERKRAQVEHARTLSPAARLVKLADKLYNLRDLRREPPPRWRASQVRGYFCWAYEVVQTVGAVNEGLQAGLDEVFASQLTVRGETFRAVPADDDERRAVLEAYYAAMETNLGRRRDQAP